MTQQTAEIERLELYGFKSDPKTDGVIKSLKTQIHRVTKEMGSIRSAMAKSNIIESHNVDKYLKLNEKLKELKEKDTVLVYLRNKLSR